MTEECKHEWKIWGVDNTTDMNKIYQCSKCGELCDEELVPYNGHLPSGIFQGQGGYSWTCSPECPKCNPPKPCPDKDGVKADPSGRGGQCGGEAMSEYKSYPKIKCSGCGCDMEHSWSFCAYCGTKLPSRS